MRKPFPQHTPSSRVVAEAFFAPVPVAFFIFPVKKAIRSTYSRVRSFVAAALRPPADEVEAYARVIAEIEGRSVEECRPEAELQLWVWHAEHAQPSRPSRRRAVA